MILVIIGESACGKSTVEKVLRRDYNYNKVTSYTSRPIREGEKDGIDYHFVSLDEFETLEQAGKFIEVGNYNNWKYGSATEDYIGNIVAVLTPHGMRTLRKKLTEDFKVVYIKVPRKDRLIASLNRSKGTYTEIEELKRRDASDVGQYDGIEDEVDIIIENPGFKKSPEEIAWEILKQINL